MANCQTSGKTEINPLDQDSVKVSYSELAYFLECVVKSESCDSIIEKQDSIIVMQKYDKEELSNDNELYRRRLDKHKKNQPIIYGVAGGAFVAAFIVGVLVGK